MSILDGLTKSIEQIRYEAILEKTPKIVQGEVGRCLSVFNDLWGSVGSPLPIEEVQAILDLFDKDAVQLFDIHSKWQTFIKSIDVDYETLIPPYAVTINEDGTVTLAEYEESVLEQYRELFPNQFPTPDAE